MSASSGRAKQNPALVWFRQDLRLADNPALTAAVARGGTVIPVYIWAPAQEGGWPPGGASRWWLHHSLAALGSALKKHGSSLVLRKGETLAELRELVRETGAGAVFWNRRCEPAAREAESTVESGLRSDALEAEGHPANLLFEPGRILTGSGGPFKVFTAFWKACLQASPPMPPLELPKRIPAPARWPRSLQLADLELEPRPDWSAGLRAAWEPGEAGATGRLRRALETVLPAYPVSRNLPGQEGSSRLSPHLHFGELSVRQFWHAVQARARQKPSQALKEAVRVFLSEIGWREFGYHLLYHFPMTPEQPMRPEFERFPWARDVRALKTWQRGKTGYPIVDAGMNELWVTGWMHNRVRMIVASFLVKDLLIPWQDGALWFWDTLVDADLASNTLGWQWCAGCGADAAPFFRIFNPLTQGERFDPDGRYVRRWLPSLERLPSAWIHRPWQAPAEVLAAAKVALGTDYPRPLVDHTAARGRALEAVKSIRGM